MQNQNFSFGPKVTKPLSPQFRQSVSQSQFQTFRGQQRPPILQQRSSNNEQAEFMSASDRQNIQYTHRNNHPYLQRDIRYEYDNQDEDDEEDNSFYSAYLKVQEQKFQQQLANLRNIDDKIRELGDLFILNMQVEKDLFQPQQQEQESLKFQSEILQFAYILGQLITINTCKENIKLKLRFRLFDILQLFNLSNKKIQRKEFYQNVSKVLGNSSHEYIDTLVKYIFHDQQQIDREQFTTIFKTNKQETQSHSSQSQPTNQLVKQFFSAICETIYFQNKLRKVAHQISYQKLEDSISRSKNFSSQDIQRFVEQTVKVKLEIDNIDTFFSRIQKPRRSGDYIISEFIEWLEVKY